MTPGVVVAMGEEEEERRLERLMERQMHHGCMAGFLHFFDRPQNLSGKRLYQPRRLTSPNSVAGSTTPSEKSMPLEKEREAAASPERTPPAAPRPSLQLPSFDFKEAGAAAMWKLREVPRLSLDSRAVVDAKGKLRPREIRTSLPEAAAPPSPASGDRRSPSVVARLMGLEALPRAPTGCGGTGGGELRRSASERVPRDPSYYRFVDPALFEKQPPPSQAAMAKPSTGEDAALRRPSDPGAPRPLQRRSHFDAREVFPDPAKRSAGAAACPGEILLYGEIERRLRLRGIAEPSKDLETLKQILEAVQLKGLLHHARQPPVSSARPTRRSLAETPLPPPIVVMRPGSPRLPQSPPARTAAARRVRVEFDRARRPRSPDPAMSPARSPVSPSRRGPQSPQRRVSPAPSSKQLDSKKASLQATTLPSRTPRRASPNAAAGMAEDDASTTFSDGGSSSCFSAPTHWDFRSDGSLLERCDKLLSSIAAFTAADVASAADQQPSPVSVLDASFLADEDSPSSASKRAINFGSAPSPKRVTTSDPDDDEWGPETWMVGCESSDPDCAYVAQVVWLFDRKRDPADVYEELERRHEPEGDAWCSRRHHRRLLCGAAAEVLDRRHTACPWDPAARPLRGAALLAHVWAEVCRAREPVAPQADLNDLTCGAIRRDLAADARWARPDAEVADTVLQIERLVFKDLVADAIRELADAAAERRAPRRKLLF